MIKLLSNTYKQSVIEYINRNDIETTFLYSNVLHFGLENNKLKRRCGSYYGYFEKGKLMGILPFYNIGSCIPHYESQAAIPFFVQIMKKKRFQFLLGMGKIITPLYEGIKNSKTLVEYQDSSFFVNYNFKPYERHSGKFINATFNDSNMVEFIKLASLDGFKVKKNDDDVRKTLYEKSKEEDFIFLEVNGKLVAEANIQTYTPSLSQIGGVYTIREGRGKGYCKEVVSEICKRIINRGKTPVLLVRKNNTAAVKAYQDLGFIHYDDYLLIEFL